MYARPAAALAALGFALLPAAPAHALSSFATYTIDVFSGFAIALPAGVSIFPDTGDRGFFDLIEVGAAAGGEEDLSDIDASDGEASLAFSAFGVASEPGGAVVRSPFGIDNYGFRNDTGAPITLSMSWLVSAEASADVTDGPAEYEFAGASGYADIEAVWGDNGDFFAFAEAEDEAGSSPFDCGCDSLLTSFDQDEGVESVTLQAGETLAITLYADATGIADVAPVPVPAPLALLGAGVLGLGGLARRRRVRAS